jgi:hypothetical protein
MKGIIYRRKGAQTSHSTAYHEDAQNRGDAPVVGDPDQAETKGAPKQNKRYSTKMVLQLYGSCMCSQHAKA